MFLISFAYELLRRRSFTHGWKSERIFWVWRDLHCFFFYIVFGFSDSDRSFWLQVKHVWRLVAALILLSAAVVFAEGEAWEEGDREVLIRNERGAKNRG